MSQASIPINDGFSSSDSFTIRILKKQLNETVTKLNIATSRIDELENENCIYSFLTANATSTTTTNTNTTSRIDEPRNENTLTSNIKCEMGYFRQDIDRVKLTNLMQKILHGAEKAFNSTLNATRHFPGDQSVLCRLQEFLQRYCHNKEQLSDKDYTTFYHRVQGAKWMMDKKRANTAFATGRLDHNVGRKSIHNAPIKIPVPVSNLEVSYNEIRLNTISSIRKLFLESFFPQYYDMQALVLGIISNMAMQEYASCCNSQELPVLFNIFKDEFDRFVRIHVFLNVHVVKIPFNASDNRPEILLNLSEIFGRGYFNKLISTMITNSKANMKRSKAKKAEYNRNRKNILSHIESRKAIEAVEDNLTITKLKLVPKKNSVVVPITSSCIDVKPQIVLSAKVDDNNFYGEDEIISSSDSEQEKMNDDCEQEKMNEVYTTVKMESQKKRGEVYKLLSHCYPGQKEQNAEASSASKASSSKRTRSNNTEREPCNNKRTRSSCATRP